VKIPVAIKVLQDGTASRGLLDEARIMASVLHPCCVHVLAVCLASQVMLVTPLMPLGCLLDYIRKQRDNVGSKALLNWCAQIARVSLPPLTNDLIMCGGYNYDSTAIRPRYDHDHSTTYVHMDCCNEA